MENEMAATDIKSLPGMKERALDALGPCAVCGKPLLGSDKGGLSFYVVTVQHVCFDGRALRRQIGLGMLLTPALASVMGPDDDLAKIVSGPVTRAVHELCAAEVRHLALLMEEKS